VIIKNGGLGGLKKFEVEETSDQGPRCEQDLKCDQVFNLDTSARMNDHAC
jgi:hypothetical protein